MFSLWRAAPTLGPVGDVLYKAHELRLEEFDIRVLKLHRGLQGNEVVCTLEKTPLPRIPEPSTQASLKAPSNPNLDCTTLSYQWGDANKNLCKIICNKVVFYVTYNLYSALVHLRKPDCDIRLWIDAICIDQKNDEEKGRQVQRMGEIYRRSKHTIVWLGEGGFFARAAFRAFTSMAMASMEDASLRSRAPRRGPIRSMWDMLMMLHFLRRSYFARVWIIQEVALSHSIEIACGEDRISWQNFALGATVILKIGLGSRGTAGVGNVLVARALLPWALRDGEVDPAWKYQILMQRALPQAKNILAMATLFRQSQATVALDKVFGLLGLCEQIQTGSTYQIEPMYAKDDPGHQDRVFIHIARSILSSQNNLGLFSAIQRRPAKHYNFFSRWIQDIWWGPERISTLPSWVPNWGDSANAATPLSSMLTQDDRVQVAHDVEYNFESSQLANDDATTVKRAKDVDTYPSDTPGANQVPSSSYAYAQHLWLFGKFIDEIDTLGEVCNTEKSQSSMLFSFKYAFTMSENHRLEILDRWMRQFRSLVADETFWNRFISTVTCGSSTAYNEHSIMRILAEFHWRSPLNLPAAVKCVFGVCVVAPLLFSALEGRGVWERLAMYWLFPAVAYSSLWYFTFQLVPNSNFNEVWQKYGVGEDFLKADFDHMELRRMAKLKSGFLALVPEASEIGDQVWSCKGGIVPLVLRPVGNAFEMVGECYVSGISPSCSKERRILII